MTYHYTGWRDSAATAQWPPLRLAEDAPGPRRCADCAVSATFFVLAGPLFLCRACLDTRRAEVQRAREAS
jgi:hypothetical protein